MITILIDLVTAYPATPVVLWFAFAGLYVGRDVAPRRGWERVR